LEIGGIRPGEALFNAIANVVEQFVQFTDQGTRFVMDPLTNPDAMKRVFGKDYQPVFALKALPTIIFVSSFFSVLYYFGVLQFIVRVMARVMMYFMRTSGAETLSASANVFMGQTEAPLIIKPYVPRMTQSELLAVMVGGMATISGGLMAVYISMGAAPVAILATSVMAAPCSLYLAKLVLPETQTPLTSGQASILVEEQHANAIDAAAAGASEGMKLAINVAAMLIAFLAFLAMIDYLLGEVATGQSLWRTLQEAETGRLVRSLAAVLVAFAFFYLLLRSLLKLFWPQRSLQRLLPGEEPWKRVVNFGVLVLVALAFLVLLELFLTGFPRDLRLKMIFARVFAPLALLMGVQGDDIPIVANLLGTKLAANEFVAFAEMTGEYRSVLSPRAYNLATFALTGFANFASVGIQLGGIGAMAPERRSDLARLGMRALFVGFLATLVNASIAGMLM
jgi:CNT family concentrative nucleoside transporter